MAPDGQPLPGRIGILLTVLTVDGTGWNITDAQNTDIVEGTLSRSQQTTGTVGRNRPVAWGLRARWKV